MIDALGYSAIDRLLYRLAFGGIGLQRELADLEDIAFRARLNAVEVGPPVFVTSLPRAGTTMLLEILGKSQELASHSHRDMPFLLCPILWDRFSRRFHRESVLRERAHGDGTMVGYDSLEAFEEILWQLFYPKHYAGTSIGIWTAQSRNAEFEEFFRAHIRKIIALRMKPGLGRGRYLSKNNANIARIGLLRAMFPDGTIIVPFRHPMDQAISLHRQHMRFLDAHSTTPFVRNYMKWLGHFEFGQLLKPIAFGGDYDIGSAESVGFWLAYWNATFEHLLQRTENIVFVSYDVLCSRPAESLSKLGEILGIDVSCIRTESVRAPASYAPGSEEFPSGLTGRALDIYKRLRSRAILDDGVGL